MFKRTNQNINQNQQPQPMPLQTLPLHMQQQGMQQPSVQPPIIPQPTEPIPPLPAMPSQQQQALMQQMPTQQQAMLQMPMQQPAMRIQPSEPEVRFTEFDQLPMLPDFPVTTESIQYLNGFLRTQIGRRVRVEFLIGTSSFVDKEGILIGVGVNYILINETDTDDITACDFYNIKFIRFYY